MDKAMQFSWLRVGSLQHIQKKESWCAFLRFCFPLVFPLPMLRYHLHGRVI